MHLNGLAGPDCPRCHHSHSKLAAVIQRLGVTPELRFYECTTCNHLFAPPDPYPPAKSATANNA